MALTTTQQLDLIKAGIDTVLKIQSKTAQNPTWAEICKLISTKEGFYRLRVMTGFGDAGVVSEGSPVPSDSKISLFAKDFYPLMFAKAYETTYQAEAHDVYKEVANFAPDLVKSMMRRKNKEAANIFNNGFDGTNFPIYDGQALFSTAHPGAAGVAVASNIANPAIALGPIALENMMTSVFSQTDPRGESMEYESGMNLYVPNRLFPLATRIVDATKLAGGNDNDPNVTSKYFTVVRQDKLTSTTAWFLRMKDEMEHGLRMLQFMPYQIDTDKDIRVLQNLVVVFEQYITAVFQWQGTAASAGA